ncbi:MAG: hypothetical protein AB7F86_05040 [Bdellovibrionales bacterium]
MWRKSRPSPALIADHILCKLAALGDEPLNCDLATLGPLHYASLYPKSTPADALIWAQTFSGMDLNRDLAILKALVERVERRAIEEGRSRGEASCTLPRSDGMAAFPTFGVGPRAFELARRKAYSEAVERFTWASWWDNRSIGAKISRDSCINWSSSAREIVHAINDLVPIKRTIRIEPSVDTPIQTQIYFFVLENDGLVSGGASGTLEEQDHTQIRALGELSRHASAARKLLAGARAQTFYERRLAYMATHPTCPILNNRIMNSGSSVLQLPDLKFDEGVHHSMSKEVYVHRCYFENQPPFVGGDLERLCL